MPLIEADSDTSLRDRQNSTTSTINRSLEKSSHHDELQRLEPHESYEGRHRWDPNTRWTKEDEARVVRKTDIHLLLFFCLMYLGMQMDKINLANALTDNFLDDLDLTTTDFNNAVMIQRICFLLAEFPVQCLVLRVGFRNVFPYMVMAWGTVAWTRAWEGGRVAFYVTQGMIGALEGGFVPGVIFFFTFFYTSKELSIRFATLGAMTDVSHAIAGAVAAGVLEMRGVLGKSGWFWLFLIEGVMTFFIGVLSFLYLPRSPTRTTSVLCRKSWYTPREETILVNRILRDDPAKGHSSEKSTARLRDVLSAWRDRSLWGFFLLGFVGSMPTSPVNTYLHLNIKRLGFSTFQSNLLTIPHSILQIFTIIGLAYSSEYHGERTWHCIFAASFALPLLSALIALPADGNRWERYAITTLITSAPNFGPIVIAWISASAFDVKKRAITVATFTSLTLIGHIVASQIYQRSDEPYYYTGNKVLISLEFTVCLCLVAQRQYLKILNRRRQRRWEEMSAEEQAAYRNDLKAREKEGNARLDFRFSY